MFKCRPTKYMSDKQEKRVAKEIGGKVVIASGSLWFASSDVRHDDCLIECKTTSKSFYSLSLVTWNKIEREAVKDGLRIPVMCIDLEDGKYQFAVFPFGSFSVPIDLEPLATSNRSFRIKSDYSVPFVISLDSERRNNQPLRLAVIPWEAFVECLTTIV